MLWFFNTLLFFLQYTYGESWATRKVKSLGKMLQRNLAHNQHDAQAPVSNQLSIYVKTRALLDSNQRDAQAGKQ